MEAEFLLNQAHRAYLRLGEAHLAGRVLLTQGLSLVIGERAGEAVEILRRVQFAAPMMGAGALNEGGEIGLRNFLRSGHRGVASMRN